MRDEPLSFEDLSVGREWVSNARAVTAEDTVTFAALTGDRNPVHLDPVFARSTPFRRPVAHGLLGLALAGGLAWEIVPVCPVAFLGLREWHFFAPVFVGDVIRARVTVREKDLQGRGRRGVVVWRVEVLNQHGRVVQEGVMLMLVAARRAGAAHGLAEAA